MKTIKKIKYLFILSCLPILFGIACGGSSESTTTTTTTTTTTATPTPTPAPTPAPTPEPDIVSLDELTKIIANEIQSAVIAGTMEKLDPKDLCSRAPEIAKSTCIQKTASDIHKQSSDCAK